MSELNTEFTFLHQPPQGRAAIRTQPDDFQVQEILGYSPEGEGEHFFLHIRKTGENTDWVARQLAQFCQVAPRDVSYAGKKDRHAVTEQWFCVRYPGKAELNWQLFGSDTIEILSVVRHPRKLRLGNLQGNRFQLRLRQVTDMAELRQRVELIRETGVPNYFGPQRFGRENGNLDRGLALLRGEFKERQRQKKGLYISAIRSWLFNRLVSQRIAGGYWHQLFAGEALMLAGSQSCFVLDQPDSATQQRLESGDVSLTAPLWGQGEPLCTDKARAWEQSQVAEYAEVAQLLEKVGLKKERRALCLRPQDLRLEPVAEDECWLKFSLPSGAFATSVLRELCQIDEPIRGMQDNE
ncbi:tRNA pseudouridine(13) synthase TruD [Pontibacter sp. JAM-7]|uniref:tRNA pseudouridine(13) synthase TruD n=1 Tax=Pontibacter sp. JAM-7 TaxID=3366581 RepID=UPI003AF7F698